MRTPTRRMMRHQPSSVRHAVRKVTPSRSARPASAFGIATRIVRTNTARSIGRSAGASRRSSTNEEESLISERSWILGLVGKCPRGRSVPSACVCCPFIKRYERTLVAAARLSAVVAIISTRYRAKNGPPRKDRLRCRQRVLSVELISRFPTRRYWRGKERE